MKIIKDAAYHFFQTHLMNYFGVTQDSKYAIFRIIRLKSKENIMKRKINLDLNKSVEELKKLFFKRSKFQLKGKNSI